MHLQKLFHRLGVVRGKLAEHNALQRWLARKSVPLTQRLGFSVIGDHFYEPVPNLRYIQKQYKDEPRVLPGFSSTPSWMEKVERVMIPHIAEYLGSSAYVTYGRKNGMYAGWDAAYYYCLIRSTRPQAITEVGRGNSTGIAGAALERNTAEGYPGEIVSIDPYSHGAKATPCTRIMEVELERIAANERGALLLANILFIDSSHVAKWGSDVVHLFESWIPNVAANTLVHLNDIFTPYDYPLEWLVRHKRFWNEQLIFESFIAFNSAFRIECPVSYLCRTGALKQLAERVNIPELTASGGSAMWLKRIQ